MIHRLLSLHWRIIFANHRHVREYFIHVRLNFMCLGRVRDLLTRKLQQNNAYFIDEREITMTKEKYITLQGEKQWKERKKSTCINILYRHTV